MYREGLKNEMKQRIITAVIALAAFLPVIIVGGVPFIIVAYLLATIGLYELLRMRKLSLLSLPGILSLLVLWIVLLPRSLENFFLPDNFSKAEIVFIAILMFLAYTVATKNRFTFDDVSFSLLSIVYVGMGFLYFLEIREISLPLLFYSLLVIWATDSGAYFTGRALGKRKLWPEISPKKTVEGSLGGILSALVIAVLFYLFADLGLSLIKLMAVTVILSVFGQVGDLAESALKRHYGVKDSGRILPGHGGILDRFDSLLFVWPLLYFLYIM